MQTLLKKSTLFHKKEKKEWKNEEKNSFYGKKIGFHFSSSSELGMGCEKKNNFHKNQ